MKTTNILEETSIYSLSNDTSYTNFELKQVYKQSNRKSMVMILGKFQSHEAIDAGCYLLHRLRF